LLLARNGESAFKICFRLRGIRLRRLQRDFTCNAITDQSVI